MIFSYIRALANLMNQEFSQLGSQVKFTINVFNFSFGTTKWNWKLGNGPHLNDHVDDFIDNFLLPRVINSVCVSTLFFTIVSYNFLSCEISAQNVNHWFLFISIKYSRYTKADLNYAQKNSVKKMFLNFIKKLQKSTCTRVSFLIKLQAYSPQLY